MPTSRIAPGTPTQAAPNRRAQQAPTREAGHAPPAWQRGGSTAGAPVHDHSRAFWAAAIVRPQGYLASQIRKHPVCVNAALLRELVARQRPDLLDLACRARPSAVKKLVEGGAIEVSTSGHPAMTRACLAVLKDHGLIVSDEELEAAGPLRHPRFVA